MNFSERNNMVKKAVEKFKEKYSSPLDSAIILGSGMSNLFNQKIEGLEIIKEFPFSDIPGLPSSSVAGHGSKFIIGKYNNKTVVFSLGRIHLYEGHSPYLVTLIVSMFAESGIKNILLTNAAGAINENYKPGDIVLIKDHINLQGVSCLVGFEGNQKFTDMSDAYNAEKRKVLKEKFKLNEGVYVGLLGPNYETPAEIRFLKTIGADLVGMSTVQEAIIASYYKMKCCGLSLVTNMAAGIQSAPLSHQEVIDTGKLAEKKLLEIILYWINL